MLADRYQLVKRLGAGGMGVVFVALRRADAEEVALKVLRSGSPTAVRRFLKEARLAGRITHPGVVRVFDSGAYPTPAPGGLYIAMELVSGAPLSTLMAVSPLDVGTACGLATELLRSLAHVHAREVLHLDIKPDNVQIVRDGHGRLFPKLLDFGIARALGEEDDEPEGTLTGTPRYMAPEQFGRGPIGPAADLYALGLLLYTMLTGEPPYKGGIFELMVLKATTDPALPTHRGHALPAGLAGVVMKMMARNPADRFQVAADAVDALAPYATPPRCDDEVWAVAAPHTVVRDEPTVVQTSADGSLWGREADLERLRALADQVAGGDARVVWLLGPPGIGTTALAEHVALEEAERGRFDVLRGRFGLDEGAARGILGLLARRLRTHGLGGDVLLQALRDALDPSQADAALLRVLADALSGVVALSGAEGRAQHGALLAWVLRRLASRRPVLVWLDDVHHGGSDATAFVNLLAAELVLAPFPLLVLASGHDAGPRSPLAGRAGERVSTLDVGPIEPAALCAGLVSRFAIPEERAARIARLSAGNPSWALRLVHDATGLSTEGVTVDDQLVQELERQLIDVRDPLRSRRVLEVVAALGEVVHLDLLAAVAAAPELALAGKDAQLDIAIDELVGVGVLQHHTAAGDDRVGFAQPALPTLLMAAIGETRARALHRIAAETRARWAERAGWLHRERGPVGDHLAAAGRSAEATPWWMGAVIDGVAHGEPALAERYAARLRQVLPAGDPIRARAALLLGRVRMDVGDRAGAEAMLREVVDGPDPDLALVAGDRLADVYENFGDRAAWDTLMARLQEREGEAGPAGRGALRCAEALWHNTSLRYPQALEAGREAAALAETDEERQRSAQRAGFAALYLGLLDEAEAFANRALAASADRPDLELRSRRLLFSVRRSQGRIDEAVTLAERQVEGVRAHGAIARLPTALFDLAYARREAGDHIGSKETASESLRLAQELGLDVAIVWARMSLVSLDLLEGRTEGVPAAIDEMERLASAAGLGLLVQIAQILHVWYTAVVGPVPPPMLQGVIGVVSTMPDATKANPGLTDLFEALGEALLRRGEDGGAEVEAGRQILTWVADAWRRQSRTGRQHHVEGLLRRATGR